MLEDEDREQVKRSYLKRKLLSRDVFCDCNKSATKIVLDDHVW